MELRVTTFNVENMFNRYAFLDLPWEKRNYENYVHATDIVSVIDREGRIAAYGTTKIQRDNTGLAILEAKPDILAVQEIEDLNTLRIFNDVYLKNYFDRLISIDGNDPRGIDVGFLVRRGLKAEILNIRTHIDEGKDGKPVKHSSRANGYWNSNTIFSRDCLEVDVAAGETKKNKKVLTFLVNHLKAQDRDVESSSARRKLQADHVAELAQLAADQGKLPIVLGDLNVAPKTDNSLDALLQSKILKDPFPADTWTHFYSSKHEVSRLDYIFVHIGIEVEKTEIVRKGLSKECKQYKGPWFPTIDKAGTEASDHCPTTVIINV